MAAPTQIDQDGRVRVLDQLIAMLAVIRQSSDRVEARYSIDLEEELMHRRDGFISELATASR